jgi:hypothetical protein
MDIIICFPDDNRTYTIQKDIALQYPDSILSLYFASESDDPINLQDINYESFGDIFEVINGRKEMWTLNNNMLNFMDKYGLVNESLLLIHQYLNENFNSEMLSIKKFIDGDIKCIFPDSFEKYNKYKQIFSKHKNIIPVQVTIESDAIVCVHIYECIPIYYFNQLKLYLDRNNETIKNLKFENITDVNMMKYEMIVKNLGCDICILCKKHEKKDGKTINGCPDCVRCDNAPNRMYNDIPNIYVDDFDDYFTTIHNIVYDERSRSAEHYLKPIPVIKNQINLTNRATPEFINDMPTYFEKINNIIPKNYEDFKPQYFSVPSNNGVDHSNIKTYSLFVNIH